MIVISDTTPIITLIKINRIDLLEKLFGEVFIPEAVFRELTTNTAFADEAEIVKASSFLKIKTVQNQQSLSILQAVSGLDDGESEAIILAGELGSDALIIDERKGRKIAQKLGITITGTIGILIQAHNENYGFGNHIFFFGFSILAWFVFHYLLFSLINSFIRNLEGKSGVSLIERDFKELGNN